MDTLLFVVAVLAAAGGILFVGGVIEWKYPYIGRLVEGVKTALRTLSEFFGAVLGLGQFLGVLLSAVIEALSEWVRENFWWLFRWVCYFALAYFAWLYGIPFIAEYWGEIVLVIAVLLVLFYLCLCLVQWLLESEQVLIMGEEGVTGWGWLIAFLAIILAILLGWFLVQSGELFESALSGMGWFLVALIGSLVTMVMSIFGWIKQGAFVILMWAVLTLVLTISSCSEQPAPRAPVVAPVPRQPDPRLVPPPAQEYRVISGVKVHPNDGCISITRRGGNELSLSQCRRLAEVHDRKVVKRGDITMAPVVKIGEQEWYLVQQTSTGIRFWVMPKE